MKLTLQDRCDQYYQTFPNWNVPVVGIDGRITGIWLLGNDYRSKTGYYGEYPPNYVRRVRTLFPEIFADEILHLFSGAIVTASLTLDINPDVNPRIVWDAEKLSEYPKTFIWKKIKLILADPPYSEEDAKHYGTPFVSRNKVMKELAKVCHPGTWVVWLDQVWPMYRKDEWRLRGIIGVVRSTNHRVRMMFMFQKRAIQQPL